MSAPKTRAKPNEQSELFFFDEVVSRPRWEDLPHEARRTVTELFARMLRQRRQGNAQSAAHEEEHE
jgi:hypothetical protein